MLGRYLSDIQVFLFHLHLVVFLRHPGRREPQLLGNGRKGEALAAKYYMRRGYLLLNHNYRTRMGELDLVLYKDGQLVFAEVKTRAGRMLDAPAAAVDARKQRRLILAAQYYLQHSPYADASIRFDVVEVTPAGDAWQIHCIPDAFQC